MVSNLKLETKDICGKEKFAATMGKAFSVTTVTMVAAANKRKTPLDELKSIEMIVALASITVACAF